MTLTAFPASGFEYNTSRKLTEELFQTSSLTQAQNNELKASGIDTEVISVNWQNANLLGADAPEIAEHYTSHQKQTSFVGVGAARALKSHGNRYRHLIQGGWMVTGDSNIAGGWNPMIKPAAPRRNQESGKVVKYETLAGYSATPIFLNVPDKLAATILKNYKVDASLLETQTFWEIVMTHPQIPVIITEGAKKAGCAISNGYVAIALRGIQCFTKRDELGERYLMDCLKPFMSDRTLYMAFDQDDKEATRTAVARAAQTFGRLAKKAGAKPVKNLVWSSTAGKGLDDMLVATPNRQKALDELVLSAQPLDAQDRALRNQAVVRSMLRRNKRTEGIEFKSEGKYIGELPQLNIGDFAFLEAPTGAGKTTAFRKQIAPWAKAQGLFTVFLCPTNGLGRQVAGKLGYPHLRQDGFTWSQALAAGGLVLCAEGLEAVAGQIAGYTGGILMVLDEVQQVTAQLADGGTTGDRQSTILQHLQNLTRRAKQNGAFIGMEASFLDSTVEFIKELADGSDVRIWQHTRNQEGWDVQIATVGKFSTKGAFAAQTLGEVKAGKKVFFASDSQASAEQLESMALADGITNVLRIDSRTSDSPEAQAFLADPDKALEQGGYDLVIVSPSVKSGLSIDSNYFNAVYGLFINLDAETAMQMLARVRDNSIPRYILCKEYLAYDPSLAFARDTEQALTAASEEAKQQAMLIGLDKHSAESLVYGSNLTTILARYQVEIGRHVQSMRSAHFECLKALLIDGGHNVQVLEDGYGNTGAEAWAEAKEAVQTGRSLELASSVIDPEVHNEEWAKEASMNATLTLEERVRLQKYMLMQGHPGVDFNCPMVCRVVLYEHGGKVVKQVSELTNLRKISFLKEVDLKKLQRQAEQATGVNLRKIPKDWLRAATMNALGLLDIIDGAEFSNDTENAIAFKAKAVKAASSIQALFGFHMHEGETPVKIISKFLVRLGLKTEVVRSEGPQGAQVKIRKVSAEENEVIVALLEARATKLQIRADELKAKKEAEEAAVAAAPAPEAWETMVVEAEAEEEYEFTYEEEEETWEDEFTYNPDEDE